MARPGWLDDLARLDVAVYAAVAGTPTPALDEPMRRLSGAADRSKLNLAAAALLAVAGGEKGRQAARAGVVSVAAASVVVNAVVKPLARRRRPERDFHSVPEARHVRMPTSRSLPSGHSASAFAFATAAGQVLPYSGAPLRTNF
jgi:membrane-associated phospholipid phosphatase